MNPTRHTHFRALLAAALAAGCGGQSPTPEGSTDAARTAPEAPADAAPETPADAAPDAPTAEVECISLTPGFDLKPAEPADAILYRGNSPVAPHQTRGEPCVTASDPDACAAQVEALTSSPPAEDEMPALILESCMDEPGIRGRGSLGPTCTQWTIGYLRGAEVTWPETTEDLLASLGPVDSAGDAKLALSLAGHDVGCVSSTMVDGAWEGRHSKLVNDCPITHRTTVYTVSPAGEIAVKSSTENLGKGCIGRLPPGLHGVEACSDGVADYLASSAHLEAASVTAFEVLHRELAHHGAPQTLLDRILEARDDEVRHAQQVGRLATALGASVPEVQVDAVPIRSLEAIALENVEEGLVRESWGAAVGLWQASHAEMPEVAAMMAGVALDEVRHAELSRALHAWLWERLDDGARARLMAAHARAWAETREAVYATREDHRTRALGLPTGQTARQMVDVLCRETLAAA